MKKIANAMHMHKKIFKNYKKTNEIYLMDIMKKLTCVFCSEFILTIKILLRAKEVNLYNEVRIQLGKR